MKRNFADIPFSPAKWPFFYGWAIVMTSTLAIIASIPGQTMGIGVFTDHLIEALGLSREQLSRSYMFGTIISGMILPIAGRLIDRLGVRIMAIVASLGLGISLLTISRCDRIIERLSPCVAEGYLIYLMITVMMLCFLLIRFFGQGNLTMVGRVAMGKWFNHRRGLATAISGIFVTFGFSSAPLLLDHLIKAFGWRSAYVVLAAGTGLVMSVIAWIFFRDNPEQCGLVMDGVTDEAWLAEQAEKAPDIRKEFTRKEAAGTLTFWAFTLGLATYAFVVTSVTFHLTSLGEEMGRSREATLAIFLPMSCIGICTRFSSSWLIDRTSIRLKWHLIAMMSAEILGAVGLFFFASPAGWAMMAVGYGMTGGLMGALLNLTWPRFFGREHLGAISGLSLSILVWASAIGPWLFSLSHNMTGNYKTAICICALLPTTIIIAAIKAENPQNDID